MLNRAFYALYIYKQSSCVSISKYQIEIKIVD